MSAQRSIFHATLTVGIFVLSALVAFSTSAEFIKIKLSDGAEIEAYLYKPSGPGPYPGVFVLHHAGGMTDDVKEFSDDLSKKGFVTLAVDFGRSGWLDANVIASFEYLQKLPMVDGRRLGFVGFSKGARLGLEMVIYFKSANPDLPIRAFVSYYVGNSLDVMATPELPPVLFLHGGRDPEVDAELLVTFCKMQKDLGGVCEAKIYEYASHAFTRDSGYGNYDHQATADALKRTGTFLHQHLGNASVQ